MAYYVVYAPDDTVTAISIFNDYAGAEESNRRALAANWNPLDYVTPALICSCQGFDLCCNRIFFHFVHSSAMPLQSEAQVRRQPIARSSIDHLPFANLAPSRSSSCEQASVRPFQIRSTEIFCQKVVAADGTTYAPGEGMATLPLPRWQPFPQNASLLSLFFLAKKDSNKSSRDMSLRLRIRLEQKRLVGGLCFSGLPYLPYRITAAGESSSSFGVPREVRLTCVAGSKDRWNTSRNTDFLDAEIAVTRQEIAWHSGFQFVLTDPTLTDTLIVHLSDLPLIVMRFQEPKKSGRATERYDERFGFALPYLYVFDYVERTRYRPLVAGGFLAALDEPPPKPIEIASRQITVAQSWQSEYRHFIKGHYYDFTAQSAIGTGRTYTPPATGRRLRPRPLEECFISRPLANGQKVILYFEQGEEYTRCVSGMRGFFPLSPRPISLATSRRFSIR